MWSMDFRLLQLILLGVLISPVICNPVTTNFNASIRDYSVREDDVNSTVRTLQKEEVGRYANFAPVTNPIRFKEIPDNALSGSSYSRGLHLDHGGHGGYGIHDYDDGHYGYGYEGGYDHHGGFEHHGGLDHHGGYNPHHGGHHGHHLGHGYHHKHYDHALAAKTILWPLAGLAILGTAAALVSNPVLLQLGVVSGRRRRDTKENGLPNFDVLKWNEEVAQNSDDSTVSKREDSKKRMFKDAKEVLFRKAYPTLQSAIETVTVVAPEYNRYYDEDKFVPVPLKVKRN